MSTDDYADLDATAQAELVRRGDVHPKELVEAAITRLDAFDPTLNALVFRDFDRARQTAASATQAGPFTGVPFLLKDLGVDQAGLPQYEGNRVFRDLDQRAPADDELGARFRRAGLVTLGKTNVPEFGPHPTTQPEAFGPTRNPWDLDRTPGGSSGGSAAAVAAGMVPLAHGADGGGSIRIPAACCGLVGLKATRHRISRGPDVGEHWLSIGGVLTRTVADTAAALDAIEGYECGDPAWLESPAESFARAADRDPGRLRIALTLDPPMDTEVHPECARATREA